MDSLIKNFATPKNCYQNFFEIEDGSITIDSKFKNPKLSLEFLFYGNGSFIFYLNDNKITIEINDTTITYFVNDIKISEKNILRKKSWHHFCFTVKNRLMNFYLDFKEFSSHTLKNPVYKIDKLFFNSNTGLIIYSLKLFGRILNVDELRKIVGCNDSSIGFKIGICGNEGDGKLREIVNGKFIPFTGKTKWTEVNCVQLGCSTIPAEFLKQLNQSFCENIYHNNDSKSNNITKISKLENENNVLELDNENNKLLLNNNSIDLIDFQNILNNLTKKVDELQISSEQKFKLSHNYFYENINNVETILENFDYYKNYIIKISIFVDNDSNISINYRKQNREDSWIPSSGFKNIKNVLIKTFNFSYPFTLYGIKNLNLKIDIDNNDKSNNKILIETKSLDD
jgi:hypothetical protein